MSSYNGIPSEVYGTPTAAGTALATFTTEASLMGGYPIPQVPATFFNKTGLWASSAKLRAFGQAGAAAASTPTYTISARLLTSPTTWSAGGLLLGSTTALATVSGVTGGWWQLDVDIMLRSLAAGAATSSLITVGTLSGSAFTATGTMPAANVSGVNATLDATGATQYFLWLSAACSASNAANTIQLHGLKLYLEN